MKNKTKEEILKEFEKMITSYNKRRVLHSSAFLRDSTKFLSQALDEMGQEGFKKGFMQGQIKAWREATEQLSNVTKNHEK